MNMEGLMAYRDKFPQVGENVYIAPGAWIIGDVIVGNWVGIWFHTVIRGDVHYIRIGDETNIQDHATLHVTTDRFPLNIGNRVTVGHGAVIHGCTIEDECLIGMGAIIMDDAHIESHCIIAAGAVVTPGTRIPEGSLVTGIPAKVQKKLQDDGIQQIIKAAKGYVQLASEYMRLKGMENEHPIRGFLR